uniref:Pyrin domain-containing protein n=1 Tax=Amphilophus citrinellus TaxID=61819 RepID=A0A3Q0S876_AMPCI
MTIFSDMMSGDLLNTLEDLGDEDFSKFKWFLQQGDVLRGRPVIRKSRLEMSKRLETVALMMQTYEVAGAVEVTKVILEKINRNDLLQSLPENRILNRKQPYKSNG